MSERHRDDIFGDLVAALNRAVAGTNGLAVFERGSEAVEAERYERFKQAYKDIAGNYSYRKDEPHLRTFYDYFLTKLDAAAEESPTNQKRPEAEAGTTEQPVETPSGIKPEEAQKIEQWKKGVQDSIRPRMNDLLHYLHSGDVDGIMRILQSLIAAIPYHELNAENLELTYHLVIYELFLILGVDTRSEVAMSGGRIDMVVQTLDYVYVMEFKLGGTPEEALAQIDDRGYALPWSADGRRVFKVGAVFSPETRTISSWLTQN